MAYNESISYDVVEEAVGLEIVFDIYNALFYV